MRKVEGNSRSQIAWLASSTDGGGIEAHKKRTRDDAVESFCNKIDRQAVQVPELEALLARWAKEVQALMPLLKDDADARFDLSLLAGDIKGVDDSVRIHVVHFERQLAKLKAHIKRPTERPALPVGE